MQHCIGDEETERIVSLDIGNKSVYILQTTSPLHDDHHDIMYSIVLMHRHRHDSTLIFLIPILIFLHIQDKTHLTLQSGEIALATTILRRHW